MSGKATRETLAALGVIASMVFVGLEIRQNTAAVQGATLQAISDSYTSFIHANSLDASQREVELLVFDGAMAADLSPSQDMQMITSLIAWIGMRENTSMQYRVGLVDETVFDGYGWHRAIHRTPYFQEWWRTYSDGWVSGGDRACRDQPCHHPSHPLRCFLAHRAVLFPIREMACPQCTREPAELISRSPRRWPFNPQRHSMIDDPEVSPKYKAVREIDRLLDPDTRIRDRFGNLCRAMLEHQGVVVVHLSNAETISTTLATRQTGGNQRFFAAVFLRLLGAIPNEIHDLNNEFRVGVAKLLDRLPQVSKSLDIDRKAQGFERTRAFESAAPRAESYLLDALELPRHLRLFDQVHQRIMRVHKNPLVSAVIAPFLPDFLAKKNLNVILESLHEYVESEMRERITKYREIRARVNTILIDCRRYNTQFVTEFFLPFFSAVLEELDADFESSSVNKPAALSVRALGKKYPFAVPNAEVRLAFAVDNLGAGVAFDVQLSIEADKCLLVASPSRLLDELGPSTSFEPVEFHAIVDCSSEESVLVGGRVTWTNGDGKNGEWEDLFEIPTQRSDIPWTALQTSEPYSLEPVRKADELIGRSEQTMQLVAKLRSPSVGSFWIHGQRRVGKTSVVATLHDLPETKNLTILYLDTGMFIGGDAQETVNNLGDKICNQLLKSSMKFSGLAAPRFDGALFPLDDFLSEALARDPELRLVIVLDEFDELPPELYRRGGSTSHAFFMTLRSLSAREPFGFILVGGEKMPEILSTQGEVLNKFRPLRIDYLDRQSQWLDFVELVRRPVERWAEITDDAVLKLYEATAGNPFFTKFVCGALVADMLRRRDAFVTGVEMTRAIETAVEDAGINQFQHFWDDGVVATTPESTGRERARRRQVLVALGEALRSGLPATSENISSKASRFGLAETEVNRLLAAFEKRKVLVRAGDEYHCKVGLFERWLVDEGVSQLALSLVEEEGLRAELLAEEQERVKSSEIKELVDGWGSYRGTVITDVSVTSWLEQFESVHDRRIMYHLLKSIRFYSGGLIREKLRVGHGFVIRELAARGVVRRVEEGDRKGTDNILISYYGGEGKRGPSYAKLYADENRIYHRRITPPEQLRRQVETLEDVEGIVFVDDFIGTGRTASRFLTDALPPIAELLTERDVSVFLVAISGFSAAGEKVRRRMIEGGHRVTVSIADPLDDSDKCFSETSTSFPNSARRAEAREIARAYGAKLSKRTPLGVGDCQALVVFEMTCPNNSLPILWASGSDNGWHPLFPRP